MAAWRGDIFSHLLLGQTLGCRLTESARKIERGAPRLSCRIGLKFGAHAGEPVGRDINGSSPTPVSIALDPDHPRTRLQALHLDWCHTHTLPIDEDGGARRARFDRKCADELRGRCLGLGPGQSCIARSPGCGASRTTRGDDAG
jgi:hypothetical protein